MEEIRVKFTDDFDGLLEKHCPDYKKQVERAARDKLLELLSKVFDAERKAAPPK